MGFVANFIHFPAVQKLWKSVKIWQSYREFKSGNFFGTRCRLIGLHYTTGLASVSLTYWASESYCFGEMTQNNGH